ncbi:MAG TPA: LamG domain-containing protein [Verrucomicrobiae bacterium]
MLTLGLLGVSAHADITVIREYHMGEADSGAVVGGAATSSADSIGGNNLNMRGDPFSYPVYSSDIPSDTNSSKSISFNGASEGIANLVTNLTDNFGIEAWVKTTATSGNHYAVYDGNSISSGFGFLQSGTSYVALFGGVVAFGLAPAPANQWTDVALVRSNGLAVLYVNGVPAGSTTAAPNVPAGSLIVGDNPAYPGFESWVGQLDEVRVFTFAPGAFQAKDLLLYDVTSSALNFSLRTNSFALTWPTNVSRLFGLEYTTNLSSPNWIKLYASLTNGMFALNDPLLPGNRFYRLNAMAGTPCGSNGPPYLPQGSQILINGQPITDANIIIPQDSGFADLGIADGQQVTNHDIVLPISAVATANTFDASAFFDPSACPGESLHYLWTLTHGPNTPGMSGTDTSILTLDTNTLVTGTYKLNLAVLGSDGRVANKKFSLTFTNNVANSCGLQPLPAEGGGGLAPFLPDGSYFDNGGLLLQDPGTASFVASFDDGGGFFEVDFPVNGNDGFILDASAVIDPATCNNSSLTFHWELQDSSETALHPIGVTGFDTPVLTAIPLSLRDGQYTVYLSVVGVNTQSAFRFVIDISGVGNMAGFH